VRLCLQEAEAAAVPFPTAAHAHDLLAATMARGLAGADYCSLVEAVEGLAARRL
jgi:3-hydroxyisobutyrate dehydrogenase-like beta-hydroxyacid dehydrogenase